MHEVWDHAQLRARNRWAEVDTPAGKVQALLPPGVPASFDPRMDPIPAIGQHTDAILDELGYDRAAIAGLRARGVV
jgi:itaconate CoA-transferase